MSINNLQITIRGLDPATKQALVKQAAARGVSLNRYALDSLRQNAGVDPANQARLERVMAAVSKHRIPTDEIQRIDDAITWHKQASLKKQLQDEHDAGF